MALIHTFILFLRAFAGTLVVVGFRPGPFAERFGDASTSKQTHLHTEPTFILRLKGLRTQRWLTQAHFSISRLSLITYGVFCSLSNIAFLITNSPFRDQASSKPGLLVKRSPNTMPQLCRLTRHDASTTKSYTNSYS